jgi:hypothetical protein
MSRVQRQRTEDREDRLREAEGAAEGVAAQGRRVETQLSLVSKLTNGWRRVHETNHLAQLFRDEGQLG